ncbi:hypothetical protein THAOC_25851 [Thalassiosira oceanica]|uniref:Uncharacterized protein n=1 Tax=Thalassiosira oceanica TaxID=159749 RepID=K0S0B1_THAOC|nr:hypothetical protein THAOC_25851 [Thalassiosira oceanica]|eukprot:EJK54516.1 hypothetical protein THAOC_25851 [Thalassiosira oceanica]
MPECIPGIQPRHYTLPNRDLCYTTLNLLNNLTTIRNLFDESKKPPSKAKLSTIRLDTTNVDALSYVWIELQSHIPVDMHTGNGIRTIGLLSKLGRFINFVEHLVIDFIIISPSFEVLSTQVLIK